MFMTGTTRPKTYFPVSFCLLGSVKILLGFEIPCVRVCHQASSSWISSQGDNAFLLWFFKKKIWKGLSSTWEIGWIWILLLQQMQCL